MKSRVILPMVALLFVLGLCENAFAQSDVCGISATTLTVNATCTFQAGSTTALFTDDPFESSCGGDDDDDGWYKFTATSAETIVNLDSDAGDDFTLTVLSDCSTEMACADNTFSDGIESLTVATTAGNTYYVHVYDGGTGGGSFQICVSEGVTCTGSVTPADNCASAPLLSSFDNFCGTTSSSYTVDANGAWSCGVVNNNSWVRFIASATTVEIDWYIPSGNTCSNGAQFQVFSGSCGSFTAVSGTCLNPTGGVGSSGTWTLNGLSVGQTYYIMIDGYAGQECDYYFNPQSGIQVSCQADAGTWN